jgi:hypothetical protein
MFSLSAARAGILAHLLGVGARVGEALLELGQARFEGAPRFAVAGGGEPPGGAEKPERSGSFTENLRKSSG